jgi:hypothetical protein
MNRDEFALFMFLLCLVGVTLSAFAGIIPFVVALGIILGMGVGWFLAGLLFL